MHIGIVTDEVARHLETALEILAGWGLTRFELREGEDARFPAFTPAEVEAVETALRDGAQVTAVSPGLFKGHAADTHRLRDELENRLPRAIELALRFEAPMLILFGFEHEGSPDLGNRVTVLRAFEQAGEAAAAAGLTVALENEPRFWIDRPADIVDLLGELDHPAVRINWDPANQHWGGLEPTRAHVEQLASYIANVHVKDFTPDDLKVPWRPLGRGITPWANLLQWLKAEIALGHLTIETHCEPLIENSRESLDHLQALLAQTV